MAVEVPLTHGLVAVIDDIDATTVRQHRWHAFPSKGSLHTWWYARRRMPSTTQLLHHFLTGWRYVDHINGDGLDNRRCNLRPASRSQNGANQRKSRGTSQFKGVSWKTRDRAWVAQIEVNGRGIWLGTFQGEEAAALAYDVAAREHFGTFGTFNFPRPGERSALEDTPAAVAGQRGRGRQR